MRRFSVPNAPPPQTPALRLRSELASAPPHQASSYPLLLPLLPPISTEAPRRLPSAAVNGIRYREEDEDTVAVEMGMARCSSRCCFCLHRPSRRQQDHMNALRSPP
uniref:Uncharacterized protein n=1 Tax=Oryza barthii TaxID=65489 RepID=A0A0D3H4M5_9ORYZ